MHLNACEHVYFVVMATAARPAESTDQPEPLKAAQATSCCQHAEQFGEQTGGAGPEDKE